MAKRDSETKERERVDCSDVKPDERPNGMETTCAHASVSKQGGRRTSVHIKQTETETLRIGRTDGRRDRREARPSSRTSPPASVTVSYRFSY
ncbi:hypothetical protein RB195_011964 [Necator americanus]|uniref:Uncharacterized protein n=1 Tax=Necator americanus TaxID=51031 RepID=A0ABR1D817_NECAM